MSVLEGVSSLPIEPGPNGVDRPQEVPAGESTMTDADDGNITMSH